MRARLALFIDKIIVFVVLIAAFPDLAFAQLRIIPENDLIRIQEELFPEIVGFAVSETNWKGRRYYFIAGRTLEDSVENKALLRTGMDQSSRKALVLAIRPGPDQAVFLDMKYYIMGRFWKQGRYYYSLSYAPIDSVKVLSSSSRPGADFILIGRGR